MGGGERRKGGGGEEEEGRDVDKGELKDEAKYSTRKEGGREEGRKG